MLLRKVGPFNYKTVGEHDLPYWYYRTLHLCYYRMEEFFPEIDTTKPLVLEIYNVEAKNRVKVESSVVGNAIDVEKRTYVPVWPAILAYFRRYFTGPIYVGIKQ